VHETIGGYKTKAQRMIGGLEIQHGRSKSKIWEGPK
jgi:hypothetical protein